MKVTTITGIVENGQIRLADNVKLPEKATVYVVVPGIDMVSEPHVRSPQLANREEIVDFKKTVTEEPDDAGI